MEIKSDFGMIHGFPMTPVGPPNESDIELLVSDLLCPISNTWDVVKITRYLPQYEATILRLITSSSPAPDSLVWLPEKTGVYSTKTGYGLGMSSHFETGATPTTFNWTKSIWNVKTAPKIKRFSVEDRSQSDPSQFKSSYSRHTSLSLQKLQRRGR